jgi:hypothetical protein
VDGLKHQKEKRSMDHFAGLDVSVKETSVCILDDTGRIAREVARRRGIKKAIVAPARRLAVIMHVLRRRIPFLYRGTSRDRQRTGSERFALVLGQSGSTKNQRTHQGWNGQSEGEGHQDRTAEAWTRATPEDRPAGRQNMRHFYKLAESAEAVLAEMSADRTASMPAADQFKYLLAEVKKAAGLRELAQARARDAAPYMHARLATIEHKVEVGATTVAVRLPEVCLDTSEWPKKYVPQQVPPKKLQ